MKKLLIALFVLGLANPSFAGLKEKNVIGSWSYTVDTGQEILKGTLTFEKVDGKLTGMVNTSEGDAFSLSNIEIRDNNVLYFELQPDYEVMKISLTVEGKKYSGTLTVAGESVPITGEKLS